MHRPFSAEAKLSPIATTDSRWRLAAWLEILAVASIVCLFLTYGVAYSLVVPPFETPDEVHHYAFARHLAQGNSLPVQTVEATGRWEHEGTQAPLYYLILGRLIAGIDHSDFDQIDQVNPHANLGNPLYPGNKNYMLYSAVDRPLEGTNLAVHIGRWFSLFLGVCTLLLVYAIARLAFPGSVLLALITLLVVASIPQVQFISATVSNDNAVILFSTAVLYWLARLVSFTPERAITWADWAVLGAMLGVAALSKLQGLGLLPLSALTILGIAWLRRDLSLPLRALIPVALPVLLIAGWWYWRNFTLYGDWLGVDQLLSINGLRAEQQTLAAFWGELRGVRYSFWGLFGWFSILLPTWVYAVLDILAVVVVAGVAWVQFRLWRSRGFSPVQQPALRVHLLLLTWTAMLVMLLFYWLSFATSGQGRLLFPALAAFGVFVVMGLEGWLRNWPSSLRLLSLLAAPTGLCMASLYALTVLFPSSYAALSPRQALPVTATPQDVTFGNVIELVGVDVAEGRYRTGDQIDVTLYLRAQAVIDKDYPLFVQLLTPDYSVVGNITSHPGWGRFPTSLWQPGQIYADRYQLRVDGPVEALSPLAATLAVGFFDPATNDLLSVRSAEAGELKFAPIGTVDLLPLKNIDVTQLDLSATEADFGETIRLRGIQFPPEIELATSSSAAVLPVSLWWEAVGSPNGNFTAFVHLINDVGEQVAGYDQPPAQGRFPTKRWQPGDQVFSEFPIPLADVPPGTYELWAGLYADVGGQNRLSVTSSTMQTQDHRILLGTVQIR